MWGILKDLVKYNIEFRIGATLILMVLTIAALSLVSPFPANVTYVVAPDVPPNAAHWFGTTSRGQDVFWQLTFAIRNTLAFGILVAVLSRLLSLTIGLVELTAAARSMQEFTFQVFEAFTAATVIYIVVNLIVVNLMRWLEKSIAVPGFIGPANVGGGGH